jgi:citrate synthase
VTDVADWWRATLIDMEPGQIDFPAHPIQDLIRTVTFPQMIWLMLRGKRPSPHRPRCERPHLLQGLIMTLSLYPVEPRAWP